MSAHKCARNGRKAKRMHKRTRRNYLLAKGLRGGVIVRSVDLCTAKGFRDMGPHLDLASNTRTALSRSGHAQGGTSLADPTRLRSTGLLPSHASKVPGRFAIAVVSDPSRRHTTSYGLRWQHPHPSHWCIGFAATAQGVNASSQPPASESVEGGQPCCVARSRAPTVLRGSSSRASACGRPQIRSTMPLSTRIEWTELACNS